MKLGLNIGLCATLSCLLLVSGCQTLQPIQVDQIQSEPVLTAAKDDTPSAPDTTTETVTTILNAEPSVSVDVNPSSDTLEKQKQAAAMHQMAIDLAKAEE
ncbi:MAG: hypothetical protein ACI9CO_001179, partial [Candidatus Azotimanducaceae bacterium]